MGAGGRGQGDRTGNSKFGQLLQKVLLVREQKLGHQLEGKGNEKGFF